MSTFRQRARYVGARVVHTSGSLQRKILSRAPALWNSYLTDIEDAGRALVTEVVTEDLQGRSVTLRGRASTPLLRWRMETMETKEPETLSWLRRFPKGYLLDVGANVGVYSIYYARVCAGRAAACEPSPYNLETLAENIRLNDCRDLIDLLPLPVSDRRNIETLHFSTLQVGGALSSLGNPIGPDGSTYFPVSGIRLPAVTLDDLVEFDLIKSVPSLLKIDVDGNEHLVLKGGASLLRNPSLVSVLVEVDSRYAQQALEVADRLSAAGFVLESRAHSEMFDGGQWQTLWNEIWVRQGLE